ncbi:hypothetical protein MP228_008823 [Amoeboaphelidium protococcarum]|nr:hypothetical protein MP228_008823 [Amoeboaphelidium protococcarum]
MVRLDQLVLVMEQTPISFIQLRQGDSQALELGAMASLRTGLPALSSV